MMTSTSACSNQMYHLSHLVLLQEQYDVHAFDWGGSRILIKESDANAV